MSDFKRLLKTLTAANKPKRQHKIIATARSVEEVIASTGHDITKDERTKDLVEVVSQEDAESACFLVCITYEGKLTYPDNVLTECAFCHRPIQHRPTAPVKPKKVCVACCLDNMGDGNAP